MTNNKKKNGRVVLIVLLAILLLLIMLFIAGWATISHYVNKIEKIPEESFLPPDALTDETDYYDPDNTDLPVLDTVDWEWEDETDPPATEPPVTASAETDSPETSPTATEPAATASETEEREPVPQETDPYTPVIVDPPATNAPDTEPPVTYPPLPEETNDPERVKVSEKDLINILLVGQDTRIEGQRMNTDSMILCSINVKAREITLVSFMRDLFVQMPTGYQDNRLNVAYIYGGFPFLYQVIEKNFDVRIDGGFEIDFSGFEEAINVLGGVDVELNEAEVRILPMCHVGMNHLNGRQALNYARLRVIGTDFQRSQRQRILLKALFDEFKDADPGTLNLLANAILPLMRTDMSSSEITGLMLKLLPVISDFKLYTFRIPVDGAYYGAYVRGMDVLIPNLTKNRLALKEFLSID